MIIKKQNLNKAISIANYILYLVLIIIVFDVLILNKWLGFGYPRHYRQENIERFPSPYVEFTGKPDTTDHNEYGFRGPSFKESKQNDLKIAFFGGSTGYYGDPPIPNIVNKELEKLTGLSVFVANYSVVSSNHRQHLHGIIEFLPQFKPDIVIFYGGHNETLQNASFDPRPGYPYNYFYRAETSPLIKLLMENSAILGEIDKRTGVFTGLEKLRKEQQPLSDGWNNRMVEKYFETLSLANNVTSIIESQRFGKTRFFAFYQPFQIPKELVPAHNDIRHKIGSIKYVFDVSSEFDALGKEIYNDVVHVKQRGNEVMGAKIAQIIAKELQLEKASKNND
ncbi:MAG: SGNH/GDSL hydrolase family protein [Deltaproteobacteria bacterium]|nr:SGNH/GDSL hydrolase family protein [Deltaproteobacteria bacterium]